ncbi:class I SAM-dependent RNA methyltransferase [Kaarinaea lacus]
MHITLHIWLLMKLGEQLTLAIIDVARGGAGVARHSDGRSVFVPYTITGDEVRASITEVKSKFAHANLIEIIKPSTQRISPRCTAFTRCGGCQWQHIPYAMQWQIKHNGVMQALRGAKINPPKNIDCFPATQVWGYRNRIQLRGHKNEIGFFAPRSHKIVAIERCDIARAEINAQLSDAKNQGQRFNKPYKVEIEVLPTGDTSMNWNAPHAAAGFRQVNDEQNKKLKNWIASAVRNEQPVLDLFGGGGNLSWSIAAAGNRVDCIDTSVPTIDPPGKPPSLNFHNAAVLTWLKQHITAVKLNQQPLHEHPMTAILDPPRGGLGNQFEDIINRLELLNVSEIIAVGCKTDTWVRDISRLLERRWRLNSIAIFDFFPHTPHVETAAHLIR